MSMTIPVPETEVMEVLEWSEEAVENDVTEHKEGTYEQGVFDAIRWMLGYIHARPGDV